MAAARATAATLELFHLQAREEHVQGQQAETVALVDSNAIPLALTLRELEECYHQVCQKSRISPIQEPYTARKETS